MEGRAGTGRKSLDSRVSHLVSDKRLGVSFPDRVVGGDSGGTNLLAGASKFGVRMDRFLR